MNNLLKISPSVTNMEIISSMSIEINLENAYMGAEYRLTKLDEL
jgi:hypothetical protein